MSEDLAAEEDKKDLAFVVTTFGGQCWESGVASAMLESFCRFWPEDILLAVVCDPDCAPLEPQIRKLLRESDILSFERPAERQKWIEKYQHVDDAAQEYREYMVRWSHKVWVMHEAGTNVTNAQHMIWLDSDIVTTQPVTHEDIKRWLPCEDELASYMGRKDWSEPETGFIAFNLEHFALLDFLANFYGLYSSGKVALEKNRCDAAIFDKVLCKFNLEQGVLFHNLTQDTQGRDVFDHSPMASHMQHFKGPKRKKEFRKMVQQAVSPQHDDPSRLIQQGVLDVNNMGIQTVNNVPIDAICNNIFRNLTQISTWLDYCAESDEEVVLVSAGPGLTRDELIPHVQAGRKIVAVKHTLERLRAWGIQPWACLLLDGRDHVAEFVQSPDKDVLYIVASMVDPKVVQTLNKNRAKVLGYHARVGQEVEQVIPAGHLVIDGGSATTTRGINVLYALGFREMHIHGADCCYFEKPDLNERKDNGRLKYAEVTLECETWGGGNVRRTFWTEGQFLAQVQEFKRMYFPMDNIDLRIYGDGIIAWMHKHWSLHKRWSHLMEEHIEGIISTKPNCSHLETLADKARKPFTDDFSVDAYDERYGLDDDLIKEMEPVYGVGECVDLSVCGLFNKSV